MCRIGAVIHFGDYRVSTDELSNLLLNMQHGGRDATGVGFIDEDTLIASKTPGPATLAVPKLTPFMNRYVKRTKVALLHTRLATHGSPESNLNNHPILGDKLMMVHNGVVWLPMKFRSNGATDTEQMLRAMEAFGVKYGLEFTHGSIAAVFGNKRTLFWMRRSISRLSAVFDAELKILVISTEMNDILKSVRFERPFEVPILPGNLYRMDIKSNNIKVLTVNEPVLHRSRVLDTTPRRTDLEIPVRSLEEAYRPEPAFDFDSIDDLHSVFEESLSETLSRLDMEDFTTVDEADSDEEMINIYENV